MPVRAIRDTYALEQTGPDTEVRRLVRAGQLVPDHYYGYEDSKAVEGDDTPTTGPAGYKYQRGEDPENPRGKDSKSVANLPEGERGRPERPRPRARSEAEGEKPIELGKSESPQSSVKADK